MLQVLELEDRVRAVGAHLERTEYLSASGKFLATWDIGDIGRAAGAGDLAVSRERLHAVLRDALEERAGASALLAGVRVRGVRQQGDSVEVALEGEGVVRADLLDNVRRCMAAGVARPGDPLLTAAALWTSLHGLVLLRASKPSFPWPPLEDMLAHLLVE